MDKLIAGRECGDCTLCCIVPAIDMPEIQKMPGATCRHCVDKSCVIYETRPEVCRKYFCAWRRLEIFGEDWRPDKSGVFAELETESAPPYATAITLTLVANPLKTVRETRFIDFVANGVNRNIPLYLGLPGPEGYLGAKLALNTREMRDAAAAARGRVKEVLERALKKLTAYSFVAPVMANSGGDVSDCI